MGAEDALKDSGWWTVLDLTVGLFWLTPGRRERVEVGHSKIRRAWRALKRVNDACKELGLERGDFEPLRRAAAPMPPQAQIWWEPGIVRGLTFLHLRNMRRAISRTRSQLEEVVARHRGG